MKGLHSENYKHHLAVEKDQTNGETDRVYELKASILLVITCPHIDT